MQQQLANIMRSKIVLLKNIPHQNFRNLLWVLTKIASRCRNSENLWVLSHLNYQKDREVALQWEKVAIIELQGRWQKVEFKLTRPRCL